MFHYSNELIGHGLMLVRMRDGLGHTYWSMVWGRGYFDMVQICLGLKIFIDHVVMLWVCWGRVFVWVGFVKLGFERWRSEPTFVLGENHEIMIANSKRTQSYFQLEKDVDGWWCDLDLANNQEVKKQRVQNYLGRTQQWKLSHMGVAMMLTL